jgi:hypothetical protein
MYIPVTRIVKTFFPDCTSQHLDSAGRAAAFIVKPPEILGL